MATATEKWTVSSGWLLKTYTVNRFYGGKELQLLLHAKPQAPNSQLLITTIPNTMTLTDGNSALAVLKDGLIGLEGVQIEALEVAICVSCVKPAALACLLTLAEQGGLSTELEGLKRLMRGLPKGSVHGSRTWQRRPRPLKLAVRAAGANSL
jgi:hypothetical protein